MSYPLRVARVPSLLFQNPISTGGTFNSGIVMASAAGFEHAAFQIISPTLVAISGFSVTVFGTLDPNVLLNAAGLTATQAGFAAGGIGSMPNNAYPAPGATGAAWAAVPSPSEQSGTGTVNNPLTALNQILETKIPFLAFWVQVVATAPTGSINVVGWSID